MPLRSVRTAPPAPYRIRTAGAAAAILAVLLVPAAAPPCWGAEPRAVLYGPAAADVGSPIMLSVVGTVSDEEPVLELARGPGPVAVTPLYGRDGKLIYGLAAAQRPGAYLFVAIASGTVGGDGGTEKRSYAFHEVAVAGVGPTPVPVPPGPTPPPTPPPTPTPTPVPVAGLRVLIVSESSANLSRGHLAVLYSSAVADYLNRKTAKDEDGQPGWRRWDPDQELTDETATWVSLWAAVKPTLARLPALVIVSDQKAEVFPLPESEAVALELLRRYGGN